jgi:hypothetical protein
MLRHVESQIQNVRYCRLEEMLTHEFQETKIVEETTHLFGVECFITSRCPEQVSLLSSKFLLALFNNRPAQPHAEPNMCTWQDVCLVNQWLSVPLKRNLNALFRTYIMSFYNLTTEVSLQRYDKTTDLQGTKESIHQSTLPRHCKSVSTAYNHQWQYIINIYEFS